MSSGKEIEGVALELTCLCGYENFQRVVVQRKPHAPVVTDFVACVGCKAMYFSPIPRPDPVAKRPGQDMTAIGGPDTSAALRRDSADAAADYRKPGRSGKR
jgi:hypothetical protein